MNFLLQALEQMGKSQERTRFPCRTVRSLLNNTEVETILPEYCVSIPRVLLVSERNGRVSRILLDLKSCLPFEMYVYFLLQSPTSVAVLGIEIETSNRVVREFRTKPGFSAASFLRLKIGDENGGKMF